MKTIYSLGLRHGYIEDEIHDTDYRFGTISRDIMQKNRNWLPFVPTGERQSSTNMETSNCTAFGTNNALETYMRCVYGQTSNFSDRYIGTRAGTTIAGNSPQTVIETIRNYSGQIDETLLPFEETSPASVYYSGVTWNMRILGAQWLRQWEIRHEWVLDGSETNWQDVLYDSLFFSPVGIAVYAWECKNDIYERHGQDTHWACLVGAEKGKSWIVADSYAPYIKRLAWDFGFTRAKRYSVKPRTDFSTQFYIRLVLGIIR